MYLYDSEDDDGLNVLHMSFPIIRITLENEISLNFISTLNVVIAGDASYYNERSMIDSDEVTYQTIHLEKHVSTIWYDTSLSVDHEIRNHSVVIRRVRKIYDLHPIISCTLDDQQTSISIKNVFASHTAAYLPKIIINRRDSKANKSSDLICYDKPNSVRDQVKFLNESNAVIMQMKPDNVQLKHFPGVAKPIWVQKPQQTL